MADQQIRNLYLNKIIKHINKVNNELHLYNKSFINQYGGKDYITTKPNTDYVTTNPTKTTTTTKYFVEDYTDDPDDTYDSDFMPATKNQIMNVVPLKNIKPQISVDEIPLPKLIFTKYNEIVIKKIIEFIKEKKKLEVIVEQNKKKLTKLTEQTTQLTQEKKNLELKIKELNDKISKNPPVNETEIINLKSELEKLKSDLLSKNTEIKNLETKLELMTVNLTKSTKELEETKTKIKTLPTENSKLKETITNLTIKVEELRKQNQESCNKIHNQLLQMYNTSNKILINNTTQLIDIYKNMYNDILNKIQIIIIENNLLNNELNKNDKSYVSTKIPNAFIDVQINYKDTDLENHLKSKIIEAQNQYTQIVTVFNNEIHKQENLLEKINNNTKK